MLRGRKDKAAPNATVTSIDGTQQNQKPADTLGRARFMALADEATNLRASVAASGHRQESSEVDPYECDGHG